jgi:hypothetical protein
MIATAFFIAVGLLAAASAFAAYADGYTEQLHETEKEDFK